MGTRFFSSGKRGGFSEEVPEPVVGRGRDAARRSPARLIFSFLILMAAWVVLSGRFDAMHLGLGVISAALVTWFSSDLLFLDPPGWRTLKLWLRFVTYVPWLLWQILLANFHVLRLVFSPRMNDLIDPHLVRLDSRLTSEMSLITYANSITLTPGTITVYVSQDGRFTVHAISRQAGDEGALRDMENKVAATFNE